jgi:CheY-like chemotaxis protein
MQNANVLIVEDYDSVRDLVSRVMDMAGHTVVGEAATFNEAMTALEAVDAGEQQCDVVILDGNLRQNEQGGNNQDAREITEFIRERELGIKVVGFSGGLPMSEDGIDVDAELRDKTQVVSELPKLIAAL